MTRRRLTERPASGSSVHVTFPLLANLYLVCTLLSTLWTLGDFTTVYLVSGGGPAGSTDVLATLGFHYAFDSASPALGVAAVMSALPVLIPLVIVLMRRSRRARCSYEHRPGTRRAGAAALSARRADRGARCLGVVLLIWSLLPVYNMLLIALDPEEGEIEFAGNLWPPEPSLDSFRDVVTQEALVSRGFLAPVRQQPLSSALVTMLLTVLIGSLASFAIGRMRLRNGWLLTNAALLTYVIPASFLSIPFYPDHAELRADDNLWSVIAAQVTFATPYAIFIFQQYGEAIPIELDERRVSTAPRRSRSISASICR